MNEDTRISVLEEKMTVANHRIDDLEDKTDRIESLTLSVQKLAMSIEQMAKEQTEYRSKQESITNRILSLEQAPAQEKARKWEDVVSSIFHYILTAILGALLAYIGLH